MVRLLAGGLARAGIDTHVATTNDNGAGTLPMNRGVPIVHDGVTYWYFQRQSRLYTFSWPLSVWLARHVSEFDVVHIHALFSFPSLVAAYWANRRGVPYIVRPLGTLNTWGIRNRRPWLKKISFRLLESRIVRHAVRVHYTSEQERLEAESLRVPARAAVIPNALSSGSRISGLAGRFRERYPQLEGRRILLFLSRLDPKKGLDLLLRALVNVRQRVPEAMLVVAGQGEEGFVSRLRAQTRTLEIEPAVLWAGFLTGEEKQAALADADVFVLPSYSENFGIAAAEAMAAGVPVIVSDQIGIHNDVAGAGAGLVVPCDVTRLTDALIRLLSDPDVRRSMGRNGRRLAETRYSLETVTGEIRCLYEEIASSWTRC
jgi:glycosyltransferase involved in cell wall biosynthesis